jgi:NADH-quinone oxidoreductase subunit E
MGTACHLKGSGRIVEDLERHLGVEAGHTTDDLSYTLETVNCLGACALAPVVVADEDYFPTVTSQKINKMLKQLTQE